MNLSLRKMVALLTLSPFLITFNAYGQTNSFSQSDGELAKLYNKIEPGGDFDSVYYYSNLFSDSFLSFINNHPGTLNHTFKFLRGNKAFNAVTSADGRFRIYSWDTWLGGSMHDFNNIFQFQSGNTVHTKTTSDSEENFGSYFTDIYTLNTGNKTYYLAVSSGSESSALAYEMLTIYTISGDTLNNNEKLIRTEDGLHPSLFFEYDFSSVIDSPQRPVRLIKYDTAKKTISLPLVLDDEKVTDRYVRYRFNGQYFEKIQETNNH